MAVNKISALFVIYLVLVSTIYPAYAAIPSYSYNANLIDAGSSMEMLVLAGNDSLVNGYVFTSRLVNLEGRASEFNAIVNVYVNGIVAGSYRTNDEGRVDMFGIELPNEQGEHELYIELVNEDETQAKPLIYTVYLDNIPPTYTIEPFPQLITDESLGIDIIFEEDVTATMRVRNTAQEFDVTDTEEFSAGENVLNVPLDEGNNTVQVLFADEAGNEVGYQTWIYSDTEPPVILDHNLNELSPATSRSVTVVGTVSEPDAEVRIYVNQDRNVFRPQCFDGEDNDRDGYIDYFNDPGCSSWDDGLEQDVNQITACNDGEDNDEDGYTDYLQDPGCESLLDDDETDYTGPPTQCSNGIDDDGDGNIDYIGLGQSSGPDRGCDSMQDDSEDSENDTDYYTVYPSVKVDNGWQFSQDISLDGSFTTFFNVNVQHIPGGAQSDSTLDNAGASGGQEFSSLAQNDVTLLAIDPVGQRSQPESATIDYQICGTNGPFVVSLSPSEVYPSIIQPDHLFNGVGQISFKLNVDYVGGDPSRVSIKETQFLPVELSEWDQRELSPRDILDPQDCVALPRSGYEFGGETFVVCQLKPFPPERFTNITEAYERLEEIGELQFPIKVVLNYQELNNQNEWEAADSMEQCIQVETALDQRLDPDIFANDLLNATVEFMDEGIEAIDSIMGPLMTANLATFGACMVSSGVGLYSYTQEAAACSTLVGNSYVRLKQYVSGCSDSGCASQIPPTVMATCNSQNMATAFGGQAAAEAACQSCAQAIYARQQQEVFRNYVCDRVFCPTVPTAQQYIRDTATHPVKRVESACSSTGLGPNPWNDQVRENLNVGTWDDQGKLQGCAAEYDRQYDSACLAYNEVKSSARLEQGDADRSFSFNRFLDNMAFCRDKDELEGKPDTVSDRFDSFYNDPDDNLDCYQIAKINTQADTFRGSNTVNPETLRQNVNTATVDISSGGTHSWVSSSNRCVERLPNGNVIFKFNDAQGQPLVYDPQEATEGTQVFIQKDVYTSTYGPGLTNLDTFEGQEGLLAERPIQTFNHPTKANTVMGLDNEGNYYVQSGEDGPFEMINIQDRNEAGQYLAMACANQDSDYANRQYAVYDPSGNQGNCRLVTSDNTELDGNSQKRVLISPGSSIANAIRCVCLPAIQGFLQTIRNIFSAVSNCFKSVLVNGEFQGGACKAVLTQYVCDLVFDAIACGVRAAGGSTSGSVDTGRNDGILNAMNYLSRGSEAMAQSFSSRYGDTATFQAVIANRKYLHAICLAAFGYDWIPEFEESLTIAGGGFSINSTAVIPIANRRFISPDPQGGAQFMYHIGYFMSAGSELSYRLELVCSDDSSCSPDDGYANGLCDCAWPGTDGERTVLVDSGALRGGQSLGDGDGKGDLYVTPPTGDSSVRYDKVRLSWQDNSGGNNHGSVVRRISKDATSVVPAACTFDATQLRFFCRLGIVSNQYGDVYFNPGMPEFVFLGEQDPLNPGFSYGDQFGVAVNAIQDFGNLPLSQQVPKFAQLVVRSGGRELYKEVTEPGQLGRTPPIVMGTEYTLDDTGDGDGFYALTTTPTKYFQEGNAINVLPFRDAVGFANRDIRSYGPMEYLVVFVDEDAQPNQVVLDPTSLGSSTQKYIVLSSSLGNRDTSRQDGGLREAIFGTQQSGRDVNTISRLTGYCETLAGGCNIKVLGTGDTLQDTLILQDVESQHTLKIKMNQGYIPKVGDHLWFEFSSQSTTSALCPPGVDQVQLEAVVTLHDGRSRYSQEDPNINNAIINPNVFEYQGTPQESVKPFTLYCNVPTQSAEGTSGSDRFLPCVENRVLSADEYRASPCTCGTENLFDGQSGYRVCRNDQPQQVCDTYGNPVDDECVCMPIYTQNNQASYDVCIPDQICNYESGAGNIHSCENPPE